MITDTLWLVAELIGLFFGVAFAIHLFQRRLGTERLRAWMGGPPVLSALKGIAIGFVTPFCTYSAMPMLIGFRQAGVPTAGYVAFITAAPVLDPVLFGALVLIVGLQAALVYTAVAFTSAMALALAAQRVGIDSYLKPLPPTLSLTSPSVSLTSPSAPVGRATAATTATTPAALPVGVAAAPGGGASTKDPQVPLPGAATCGAENVEPWQGVRVETAAAAVAAFGLLRSVAVLLLVGVITGLIIEASISPETVASITGNNDTWSIPIAAALGTPLYFHTSLFVPIANSLTNAGVGIGAIVALTISGAGANVPEFIILTKLAYRRLIVIFFGYVFTVALTGGLIAQAILS